MIRVLIMLFFIVRYDGTHYTMRTQKLKSRQLSLPHDNKQNENHLNDLTKQTPLKNRGSSWSQTVWAVHAWHGFCSASDYVRLDSFLRRCVKLSYARQSATVTDMFLEADDSLFRKILYDKAHVLHSFFLISQTLSTRFVPDLIISLLCKLPWFLWI